MEISTTRKVLNDRLRLLIKILGLILFFFIPVSEPNNQSKKPGEEVFTIACLKNIFTNVDINDAEAAVKLWAQKLENQLKFGVLIDFKIFKNTEELTAYPEKDYLGIVMLNTVDYLKVRPQMQIYPELIPDMFDEYIILTKKNISTLSDLKGKTIGILEVKSNSIPFMWLENTFRREKLKEVRKYFKKIIENTNESQLILSVFFDQNDACVVSKSAFETVTELNPQIKKELNILTGSPVFLLGVTCFTKNSIKYSYKERFTNVVLKLDTYPEGRQIMTLLKAGKMQKFKPEYLKSVELLYNEYNKPKNK